MGARERDQCSRETRVGSLSRALPRAFSNERMVRAGTRGITCDGCFLPLSAPGSTSTLAHVQKAERQRGARRDWTASKMPGVLNTGQPPSEDPFDRNRVGDSAYARRLGVAARAIAEPRPQTCSRSGARGPAKAEDRRGQVWGMSLSQIPGSLSHLLLRHSPYLHRKAAVCSARLDRSSVAVRLNDERLLSEGPSRTESHRRRRSTPSPCSHLLPHDQAHMRISLYLFFTLILNAMRCTGASRHTHDCRASTTNGRTGQEHGVRRQREAGAGKLGTCHRARCQTRSGLRPSLRFAPTSLNRPQSKTGADVAMEMTMGTRTERRKEDRRWRRGTTGNGPARRTVALWAASEGCGREIPCWGHELDKTRQGGMLLERAGSAALLHLPDVSTPCMGGLWCAP